MVEGPALPSDHKYNEKKLAKIIKAGGKRGVEIEGAAAMGGLQFFCTTMDEPEGDLTLLIECMKGMNAKSDPTEEERKGGAGRLGKIIMSMTDEKLAFVSYCPSDKPALGCKAKEWLEHVINTVVGPSTAAKCVEFKECEGCSTDNYYTALLTRDTDLNVFPIKVRDPAISTAYAYLRAKDLFPADDEDDDDEY